MPRPVLPGAAFCCPLIAVAPRRGIALPGLARPAATSDRLRRDQELPDHTNGRIYDPLLGRFLSADTIVQNPTSLQCYNRYSYVMNNPLSFTDPSGFTAEDDAMKKIAEAWQTLANHGIVGVVIKAGEVVGVVVRLPPFCGQVARKNQKGSCRAQDQACLH